MFCVLTDRPLMAAADDEVAFVLSIARGAMSGVDAAVRLADRIESSWACFSRS